MANAGSRAGILALPSASCKLTGNPYRMTGRWASLPRSASQRSPGLHQQSTSMCQRVGWPVIQVQALVPRHVRRLNPTPQHAHCFLASRPLRMSHSLHVFVAGSQSMQPSMAHCTGRRGRRGSGALMAAAGCMHKRHQTWPQRACTRKPRSPARICRSPSTSPPRTRCSDRQNRIHRTRWRVGVACTAVGQQSAGSNKVTQPAHAT